MSFQRGEDSLASYHCCVPECTASARCNSTLSFFSFPKEDDLRRKWVANIRRDHFTVTSHTKVCSRHFVPADMREPSRPQGRRRLLTGAVPVLFERESCSLPTPRPDVWERRRRPDSPDGGQEEEVEVVCPDHNYCASAAPRASAPSTPEELRSQVEDKLDSDDDVSFDMRVDQQSSEGPRSQSAQQHQTQLDSIFMLLEDKMVTFVKEELKKLQKLLGSNRSRRSESQTADEDDSDGEEDEKRSNREAFLKITLHFLRKMKQEELAERLQSMVPEGVQELVLIKVEAPEEQKPYVDQQDQEHLHIKEEVEELWTSLGEEQLNVKDETDATSFSFTAVPSKPEDDEDKPLFLQLHQHQVKVGDLPTSSSADNLQSATGGESCGGAETTRNPDLSPHEDDSDSSETEVSEDDENDSDSSETEVSEDDDEEDVNNSDSQQKHVADSGSETEDTDEDCESSSNRVPESGVKNNKNGQKLFCCELCGRCFTQKGSLNRHMRIHTGQKPFCCELCGRRFTRNGDLNKHMRVHTGQKPFCCDLCDRRFTRKEHLNAHKRIHSGQKPFCCELCDRRFTEKGSLNAHMRIHTGQKPFCCKLCGRRFSAKNYLNRHMRIHTGQKPFCCDLCDQSFIQKGNLNTHMRIHTGQKPFCCKLCGRRFSAKNYLNRHMRIHTGQKPFCCELCDRTFTEKSYLNKHMKIHTGQKLFCCDLCDRRFTTKSYLNKHVKIHTGQKPFCCDLCDRRFTRKDSLNKHKNSHRKQSFHFK